MNFSQVLTITSLVSVQWPPIYRQVQDYLGKLTNIFDVDTVGAECFSPEFAKWDNRFMVTVAGFGGLALCVVAAMIVISCVARKAPPSATAAFPAAFPAAAFQGGARLALTDFAAIVRTNQRTTVWHDSSSHVYLTCT